VFIEILHFLAGNLMRVNDNEEADVLSRTFHPQYSRVNLREESVNAGSWRRARCCACATSVLLRPRRTEHSQTEYRSRTVITKTKRSNGRRWITALISLYSCVVCCRGSHKSRCSLLEAVAGDTIPIAFLIMLCLIQVRANSLNTNCPLKDSSTVDVKHHSACSWFAVSKNTSRYKDFRCFWSTSQKSACFA
jgi:hypothetical protein